MTRPITSSVRACAQPPCSKPWRWSSSGRPGACITPSSVTCSITTTLPNAQPPSMISSRSGERAPRSSRRSRVLRVHEGPRRREELPRLEPRLEAGEDHRPAAVELRVRVLAQLVVRDGEPARVADRFDLPRDPSAALVLHLVAPKRGHGVDQAAGRVDLEDVTLAQGYGPAARAHLEARAGLPLRGRSGAEVVLAPDLGIGDRLPEALGRGLDVDLENLLHCLSLQLAFEPGQPGGPGLGVLAHPPVLHELGRAGAQAVELLATSPAG